jgi:ferrous iron transport protein B
MARIFKKFLFKGEDIPFVMELPPYRMPTGRSIMIHMWDKAYQYLKKMGGVILVASIIIWFLGYYPRQNEQNQYVQQQIEMISQSQILDDESKSTQINELNYKINVDQQQNSYIGQIGRAVEPVLKPLGFDWKISISLLTGMAAKEVVVSTLSVLYTGEDSTDNAQLAERLKLSKNNDGSLVFTPLVSLSLMFFVLIYFPCIATVIAIVRESKSWKWGVFMIVYTCLLAWIVAFAVYQVGQLFI